ncbi:Carboxypeptidase B2 [Lonchura striata]|uniref:Carboxypeptidase B2 n=1 Tax=Lonchura striata TaxID=40157 RepID=A0A218UR67_9PASE|nr:Carboxypeptidase B2 [Lonchura striata domestica]
MKEVSLVTFEHTLSFVRFLKARKNQKMPYGLTVVSTLENGFLLLFACGSQVMYHCRKAIHVRERDRTMTRLLEHFDFYIMPVINVDGYEYTWSHPSNRLWRKSRSSHGNSKCIGTDMNRNFDAHWCGPGASHSECQEIYCGPYPESEPEVKAVARFVRDHKDTIKAYITMHSYSQLVLFPYSYTMNKSKDHEELESLAQKAAKAIKRTTWKTYRPGAGAQTICKYDFTAMKGKTVYPC